MGALGAASACSTRIAGGGRSGVARARKATTVSTPSPAALGFTRYSSDLSANFPRASVVRGKRPTTAPGPGSDLRNRSRRRGTAPARVYFTTELGARSFLVEAVAPATADE